MSTDRQPFRSTRRNLAKVLLLWVALIGVSGVTGLFAANAPDLSSETLGRIDFDQKLQQQVASNLKFRDETGKSVQLGDYMGQRPVILVLGYYGCPMLCTLVLNGLVE